MATFTPDISQMRQQYADVLANQQKKAMQGVQNIYAQRGTTGGGEESTAMGDMGYQFGLGAGQQEAGLQQYMGGLGMQQAQLGEQQRQFDTGQGNWGQQFGLQQELGRGGLDLSKQQFGLQQELGRGNLGLAQQQFGEGQRQFDVGQGNWQQQFTNQLAQQKTQNNMALLPLVSQGYLTQEGAYGTGSSPFGNITTEKQLAEQSPEYEYAKKLGLSPYELSLYAANDPEGLKNLMNNASNIY